MRAVFEGLAFAARDCYAAMGPLPAEIRLSGGAPSTINLASPQPVSAEVRAIRGTLDAGSVRMKARVGAGGVGDL